MILITQINWGILEILALIITFVVGFLSTYLIIPYIIRFMKKKGFTGIDIHKNKKPEIPESGGLSILFGLVLTTIVSIIFFPTLFNELIVFLLTIIVSGSIGYFDDRKKLKSRYKIILTIFTGVIIFIANFFGYINIQSPIIPILGETRLTLIYPLVVPLIVAILTNTSNMLEGYNGEGSGASLIALCFLFISALLWHSTVALVFIISGIAVLIPFFLYNKYPAKIFPGDVGTLTMGALFACIALLGSLEVVVFSALLIHFFNSFFVVSSVRGFLESSEIQGQKSDVVLLREDLITASEEKSAALTLPRLILAKGPLTEPQLIKNFFIISVICGLFSIVSMIFIHWTLHDIGLIPLITSIITCLVAITIILYFFPRIRGIVSLMITFLGVIILLLIFIDTIIMNIFYHDIDLGFIKIPTNIIFSIIFIVPCLAIWYYLTIRYFWSQIKKIKRKIP
ncbi:MAG: hypothetical protein ACFFBH_03795 [Promethearchaeota archaeon]